MDHKSNIGPEVDISDTTQIGVSVADWLRLSHEAEALYCLKRHNRAKQSSFLFWFLDMFVSFQNVRSLELRKFWVAHLPGKR